MVFPNTSLPGSNHGEQQLESDVDRGGNYRNDSRGGGGGGRGGGRGDGEALETTIVTEMHTRGNDSGCK